MDTKKKGSYYLSEVQVLLLEKGENMIVAYILSLIFLIVTITFLPRLFDWNLKRELRACEKRGLRCTT